MKKINIKFNIFWSLTLLFTMLFFAIGGYVLGFWQNNPAMQISNYFVDESDDYVRNFDLYDSSSDMIIGKVMVTKFENKYSADFNFTSENDPPKGFSFYAFAGDQESLHNLGILKQANGPDNYRLSGDIPVSVNDFNDLKMSVYLIADSNSSKPQELASNK